MYRFKLVQCHHCFSHDGHIRPFCPFKDQEKVCYKCGQFGHSPQTCENFPWCINCAGPHPANSKQCSVYKLNLAEAKMELVHELQASYQLNLNACENSGSIQMMKAAAHESLNPYEFVTKLYEDLRKDAKDSILVEKSAVPDQDQADQLDKQLKLEIETAYSVDSEVPPAANSLPTPPASPEDEKKGNEIAKNQPLSLLSNT